MTLINSNHQYHAPKPQQSFGPPSFISYVNAKGKVKNYDIGAKLGAGAFATVYAIHNRDKRGKLTGRVLKWPQPQNFAKQETAERQMLEEFYFLRNDRPEGLIAASKQILGIHRAGRVINCAIEKRYTGTLADLYRSESFTHEMRTDAMIQILEALTKLHPERTHGDLSPQNIFYEKAADGYRYFIADVGNIRTEKDYKERPRLGPLNTHFFSVEDAGYLYPYLQTDENGKKVVKTQGWEFWQFQLARDVAAVGCIFARLLESHQSIPADLNSGFRSFSEYQRRHPGVSVIGWMLNPDFHQRPTATVALDHLKRSIRREKTQRAVAEKIGATSSPPSNALVPAPSSTHHIPA